MIIGTKDQNLRYPSILLEIITECKLNCTDCTWIPSNIFVLDDEARLGAPFHSFFELVKLALDKSEQDFLYTCNSITSNDPIILIYKSGTLGSPKGVIRSTASFLGSGSVKNGPGKAITC
jgi:fatty-acyl-CoA synthase